MESYRLMKLFLLPTVLVVMMVTAVYPQSFMSDSLSGLPSLPGLFGNGLKCSDGKSALSPLIFYIGWGDDRNGTSFGEGATGLPLGGTSDPRNWHYPNRGWWLGLSEQVQLRDRVGLGLSGWYLLPSNQTAEERAGSGGKSWELNNKWYWLDANLNIDLGIVTLLGGVRYDYNTTNLRNPFNVFGFNPSSNLTSDLTLDTFIPYLGFQYAYAGAQSYLMARAIGFPALIGTTKYQETNLTAVGDEAGRIEGSGKYGRSSFIEAFLEYSRIVSGFQIGIFARWTAINAQNIFDVGPGFPVNKPGQNSAEADFSVTRQNTTVGGNFNLAFNTPL